MKENPHLVDIEPHEAKNLSPKKRLQFKKKLNLKSIKPYLEDVNILI